MNRVAWALAAILAIPGLCAAQSPERDPGRLELTREQLIDLRAELESVVASDGYSEETRDQAASNIEAISERLTEGDFRVGDRVVLDIEGELNMPDTLMVEPGPAIEIPALGRIGLGGVLRSELEGHLTQEVGRYIQMPRLRATSLIRLSIQGEVSLPGFYAVPADMLLGDVFMVAGGPTNASRMDGVFIERGAVPLWEAEELQNAIVDGRTLDQLNLRAGDQIMVPANTDSSWYFQAFQVVAAAVSIAFLGQSVF